jgi:hypothetical protein
LPEIAAGFRGIGIAIVLFIAPPGETNRRQEGTVVADTAPQETMSQVTMPQDVTPVAATAGRSVELLGNTMTIHQLFIERASIVTYLQTIPLEKQEIALVHALEVGVTEVLARRERHKH